MNIDIINGDLEVTENPGLSTIDPRFSDISALVQDGDYLAAAGQAEAVLEEKAYDIRIIGYFLYGIFLEQGVGGMTAIFQCLARLLQESWEALGPVKKREKHAQTSLNWLMKMFLKKLQYEEEKKSSEWDAWVEQVSSDEVQETIDASAELRRSLSLVLEDASGPVLDGLMKVNDWLSGFQKVVYREPEPEPEPEQEDDHEMEPEKTTGKDLPPIAVSSAAGSYHLHILLRKLKAFERLIAEEKFPLAALVAADINNIISNFDPKIYFPEIFSQFSLLFALNTGELASFTEYKQTVQWQALEELYKVNLDAFVEFNLDRLNLDASRVGSDIREQEIDEPEDVSGSEEQGDDDWS